MGLDRSIAVSFFGAPGSTFNLGVGALRESALVGLLERQPRARLTVFDDGWGVRQSAVDIDGRPHVFQLCGVRNSRRIHKRESYANMRLSAKLGGLRNPGLRLLDDSDAVWDVSGGDSFSDLYGMQRFDTVTLPKELALARRRPLILLPQTYGPFRDPDVRRRASEVVRRAAAAWARDVDSFAALQDLLGDSYDPCRHRSGVDLAFGLRSVAPKEPLRGQLLEALDRLGDGPLAGLNVSGLILNEPGARERYGLTVDYLTLIDRLAERLLKDGARLVLVPHVLGQGGVDSDEDVTQSLHDRLSAAHPGRVLVAPRALGAGERKWLISQLDWLSGTRMHATIAGLSSGVPTAPLAYSLKVRGVFESCGQAHNVTDGRTASTDEALEGLWTSWLRRNETRTELAAALPAVLDRAKGQMDDIVASTRAWAGGERTGT